MKRYAIVFVLVMLLISGVSATSLNLQNPEDFILQVEVLMTATAEGMNWVQSTTGGNSYLEGGEGDYCCFVHPDIVARNAAKAPMTYSAATYLAQANGYQVTLYDTNGGVMATVVNTTACSGKRIELEMIGGRGYVFTDGVLSGSTAALGQNPSYVGWGPNIVYNGANGHAAGWAYIDDLVWGTNENKYVFGTPETGMYFMAKDILDPANSGFYKVNMTDPLNEPPILISSFNFTSTYSKPTTDNQTVTLNEYGGGNYQTYYTGTTQTGSIAWDLTSFFNSGAPYGLYTPTIPSSLKYPTPLPYMGLGISLQFDKDLYGSGDAAQLTSIVSDTYYLPSTYSYKAVIQDIYGTVIYDEPITYSPSQPHTGTATYIWDGANDAGLYYALIYASPLDGGDDLLMAFDYAELTQQVVIAGYVKDAQTTNIISGAEITVGQQFLSDVVYSDSNGYYTTLSEFTSSTTTTLQASATGYEYYEHSFNPLVAGLIQINLSLMPTNPSHHGIALGGIVRTPPYNRTLDDVTVSIVNSSPPYGNYTAVTNSAGFYIQDAMPHNYLWDIWGSKAGLNQSEIYHLLVVGS